MVVTYRQVRHPFRDLVPSDLLRFVGSDVMGFCGMAARYDIAGWENEETRQWFSEEKRRHVQCEGSLEAAAAAGQADEPQVQAWPMMDLRHQPWRVSDCC